MAKEIRKNTERNFVNSMGLAKAFMKNKMQYEQTENIEGFVYEFDSELSKQGRAYSECMYPTGEIYKDDDQIEKWKMPSRFYEWREKYTKVSS